MHTRTHIHSHTITSGLTDLRNRVLKSPWGMRRDKARNHKMNILCTENHVPWG